MVRGLYVVIVTPDKISDLIIAPTLSDGIVSRTYFSRISQERRDAQLASVDVAASDSPI